ncbi:MAG: phosphoadenosine phosphosulfate reductase family protein [Candidatus Aminicenantes bacterium]|nr:phosphoadenosine phosphosulfate reductase family protein [Candidatus Aminicenantes bacterium]
MSRKHIDLKIKSATDLIKRVLANHENPVVACSFGKNSMVVLHMVRQFNPEVCVLFNNTLMEYPDTYKFKKIISRKWNLNLIETRPLKTFWWVVENYGFPLFSRKGHKDASKNCCRYLKEYPIKKVLRQHKFDLYFTGLSRHESRLREFSAKKYGNYFYSRTFKHWKCHPIQDWTKEDIWAYHEIYNIPYNSLYDKKAPDGFDLRTGCWCCTIPIKYGKIEFLRKNYPHLWKLLLKKGLGSLILEKKVGVSLPDGQIDDLIQNRPCFFDKY